MKAGSTTTAVAKRRERRRERGGSVTEAVVITPCFIIVVFMSIQFMIISFRAVTLQWITTAVMRDIALWVIERDANGEPTQKSRDSTVVYHKSIDRANNLAASIGIHLDTGGSPAAFCLRNVTAGGSQCVTTWAPGTTLQLQLRYNIPLFFSKLLFVNIPTQTVTGTATAVTENFPQNN